MPRRSIEPVGSSLPRDVRGSLTEWDARDEVTPIHVAAYHDEVPVHLEAGWVLHATVASEAFDSTLALVSRGDRDVIEVENDGWPRWEHEGSGSEIHFEVEQTGDYLVRVSSANELGTGVYRLLVEAGPDVACVETEDDTFDGL